MHDRLHLHRKNILPGFSVDRNRDANFRRARVVVEVTVMSWRIPDPQEQTLVDGNVLRVTFPRHIFTRNGGLVAQQCNQQTSTERLAATLRVWDGGVPSTLTVTLNFCFTRAAASDSRDRGVQNCVARVFTALTLRIYDATGWTCNSSWSAMSLSS